jgi:signal transduction histidine kinase
MSLLKGKDCQNESHPTSSIFPDGGKKIKEETGFFQRFIREKTRRWIGLGLIGVFVFLIADKYIKWSNIEGWVGANRMILKLNGKTLRDKITNPNEWFHNMLLAAKEVTFDYFTDDYKEIAIQVFALLIKSHRGVILQMRILDQTGMEKIRVNFKDDRVVAVSEIDLQDKSSRYYFKKAQKLKKGEVYISMIDLNKEKGEIVEPRQVTVRFTSKVFFGKSNLPGYVVANFRFPELIKLVDNFSEANSKIRIWNEKTNESGQIVERQIIGSNERSNEPCQLYKFYGAKEDIPYYDSACKVLSKSDVASVKLPFTIKGHHYTAEIYSKIEEIIEQSRNKNVPLFLATIIVGISALMFKGGEWRNKAIKSEHLLQLSKELKRETSFVLLLQKVAVSANESTTVEGALQTCIDLVCDHTRWPVGHVYMPAKDNPKKLIPTDIWHLGGHQDFIIFQKVTKETSFNLGEGLPGRALSSGKPEWVIDVTKDSNFPRAKLAENIGVKSGFSFPVLIGLEAVGVLEFFSSDVIEPDHELMKVMANIGTQLGRVVERKQAEAALKEFSRKLVESQENERKRIAAELHDSLGQNLIVIKNEIKKCLKTISEDNRDSETLEFTSSIVTQTLNEIKEIAYNLRPPQLDKLGLKDAISSQVKRVLNTSETAIFMEIDTDDVEIPPDTEINIFRIIQEGINNILKHSSASEAIIKLKKVKENIYLEISDNGEGFDNKKEKEQNVAYEGFGLKGMAERATMLGGTFQVNSKKGIETTLKIVIPICRSNASTKKEFFSF